MATLADLRVLFMGSPEFALPSLQAISEHVTLVGAITQPDKPAGRGRRMTATPVAEFARARNLPLLQPRTLRRPEIVEAIRGLRPDVTVTVAYGRIIPPDVLSIPPLGSINAHPSLLPRYRGASPIHRAIADGETETGVTILYQVEALDAGDIILQERVPIGQEESADELEVRLAEVAARLLLEALGLIAAGRAPRRRQDESQATYVGRLTKEEGLIDWSRPADHIVNLIRAMNPWPSASTVRQGKPLKIWRAQAVAVDRTAAPGVTAPGTTASGTAAPGTAAPGTAAPGPAEPGTVLAVEREGVTVAAGEGMVRVLEVQPEGGRRMTAGEYARGYRLRPGERWGIVKSGEIA